ncbi:hypothetical protein V8G54_005205 [Vigna mungo]|uniref:Uncharacterized protein n=1 Tax=Vigna mungo TaxID=3915 RepID=A0AAQ3PF95_VIGMU
MLWLVEPKEFLFAGGIVEKEFSTRRGGIRRAENLQLTGTMTTSDIARTVVGIIGNVISGALFLSPVPTFIEIWKKRSVEQFSPIPYLAMVVNCMVWTLYGLPMVHPHSILVITINGSGSVVALIFIGLFLIYSDGKKRLKVILWLLLELLFIAALTFVTLTQVHTFKKRSEIVGTVCILFNIMMYASPLSVMVIFFLSLLFY